MLTIGRTPQGLIWIICCLCIPYKAESFRLGKWIRRAETQEIGPRLSTDPQYCSNHVTLQGMDDDVWMDYEEHLEQWQTIYKQELAPHTLASHHLMFTAPLSNADFISWGSNGPKAYLSMWNATTMLEGEEHMPRSKQTFKITHASVTEDIIGQITSSLVLDGDLHDYIVILLSLFEHPMDALGYLAYLRESEPMRTRFVIVDNDDDFAWSNGKKQDQLKLILEALDAEFSQRLEWVTCLDGNICNQRVQIRGEGTMKLLRPESSPQHTQLLLKAREWIFRTNPPKTPEKTIIYYRPSSDVLLPQQHDEIIEILQQVVKDKGRSEKVVIFDETVSNLMLSYKEVFQLFQSATLIVGPNVGEGLKHALFVSMGTSCEMRPKLLEILPSESHFLDTSLYLQYSTIPWMEVHCLKMTSSSSQALPHDNVDLLAFQQALLKIMWAEDEEIHATDHREAI